MTPHAAAPAAPNTPVAPLDAPLRVGGLSLQSRLVVGTGKYAGYAEMARCLAASGTDCVTVAVRRERLVDAQGRRLEVTPIDIPPRLAFAGTQLPASHLNFYVANGVVAAPVFLDRTDEAALRTLEDCFPGRTIEPVACNELIRGRGALHCITRDQPAVFLGGMP